MEPAGAGRVEGVRATRAVFLWRSSSAGRAGGRRRCRAPRLAGAAGGCRPRRPTRRATWRPAVARTIPAAAGALLLLQKAAAASLALHRAGRRRCWRASAATPRSSTRSATRTGSLPLRASGGIGVPPQRPKRSSGRSRRRRSRTSPSRRPGPPRRTSGARCVQYGATTLALAARRRAGCLVPAVPRGGAWRWGRTALALLDGAASTEFGGDGSYVVTSTLCRPPRVGWPSGRSVATAP